MKKQTFPAVVKIQAVPSALRGRWHFRATNTPDPYHLGANHARSLRTYASARGAERAGCTSYGCATEVVR